MRPLIAASSVRVGLRKDMTVGDLLQHMQGELVSTIQHEHEGSSAMAECLGAGAILPGMMDWHPLGSDLFSRSLEHKTSSRELSRDCEVGELLLDEAEGMTVVKARL